MTAIAIDHARLAQAPLGFLRQVLDLPSDSGLFYAFGGSLERADAEPCRPLKANVLCEVQAAEVQAAEWWRECRHYAKHRAGDPVRSAVRHRVEPVRWRNYENSMSATALAMWRRSRAIGLCDGLTVPLHDPAAKRYGVLSVLHFGRPAEFDDWIGGHGEMLGPAAYPAHLAISGAQQPLPREAAALSQRERQCLALIAEGWSSKHIGRRLELSPRTVELHVARAMRRLGAVNRSHAVALALRQNLLAS
ncbi:MAG: LuxR C-terminal-related transcriptional regulator [Pseudolabrys sp.]|jgi:LuxR family quorum sensing-dependent transcriptional regulator